MRILRLIPVVAAKGDVFAVGDRIAGEYDLWYLGTVVKGPAGKICVKYDNGDKGVYSEKQGQKSDLVLLVPDAPKKTSGLTWAQVTKYLRSNRLRVTPSPTTPTRTPTKTPKIKVTEPIDPLSELDTSKEQALLVRVGPRSSLFQRAQTGGTHEKLVWIQTQWMHANIKLFGSRMEAPSFRLLKEVSGDRFRTRGVWYPNKRVLALSPRIFKSKEEIVLSTLVHEMCHQAVTDLDRVVDRSQGGHGPYWQRHMRSVGLNPLRYSEYDNLVYMDAEEREAAQRKAKADREARELREAQQNTAGRLSPSQLRRDMPAQWFDPRTNVWHKGLIAGPNDKAEHRWAFINNPLATTFQIVPATWFSKLPAHEETQYTSEQWKRVAERTRVYIENKSKSRGTNKWLRSLGL